MSRSEFDANLSLQATPKQHQAAWMKPSTCRKGAPKHTQQATSKQANSLFGRFVSSLF